MSKKVDPATDKALSVCDVMKGDTSEIIKKLESQIPVMFQNYSDLYTQYLHTIDDVFGACYVAEKEFFDRFGTDQTVLKQIRANSKTFKECYLRNIEMSSKFLDEYTKARIEAAKSFDAYMHTVMNSYAGMLAQFNRIAGSHS